MVFLRKEFRRGGSEVVDRCSCRRQSPVACVVKDEVEVDNGNHTISQIEPINGPISCITDDKQQTSSPLSRRPPHPHPPSSPTTVAILPAESLSGHRDFKFLQHLVGGKSVASIEQVQVKPRTQVVPEQLEFGGTQVWDSRLSNR
ncbi:hypothetical protein B0H13DRAFT_1882928 [Mycena leptocephala]|nr:hypothetical protein B0H13DRAFT_1882928 [Mycena leptocephala]